MKFNVKDKWYMESDCGKYRISKSFVFAMVKYTAWHREHIVDGQRKPSKMLGVSDDKLECIKWCQEHEQVQTSSKN
jgi:hypothetical protein